eukprot:TRINITY_DN389_c0_g1_i2.p1 TRINITY_DN389_c0_g1~~TRINITY_DN389_c0_g1_i2.p1  ORF type:complete len:114 (-),score=32.41 TRINITY_DN389_c0_g1_i2:6-305(-)
MSKDKEKEETQLSALQNESEKTASIDSAQATQAMGKLSSQSDQQKEAELEKKKKLASVTVKQEDVTLLAEQFEITRREADIVLRAVSYTHLTLPTKRIV